MNVGDLLEAATRGIRLDILEYLLDRGPGTVDQIGEGIATNPGNVQNLISGMRRVGVVQQNKVGSAVYSGPGAKKRLYHLHPAVAKWLMETRRMRDAVVNPGG